MRKLIASLVAVTMIMVSGIGVFAAGSNTGGAVSAEPTVTAAAKSITVANANGAVIKYKLKGAKKYKTASSATIKGLKKGKTYIVKVGDKTYKVLTAKGKIKSAKVKGSKVAVKFSKKKGAKKYVIKAVRKSDGKVVKKTVKKATYKLKLDAGEWTITVTPKNGAYKGTASAVKVVTVG